MTLKIVTDSTCDLPANQPDTGAITIVPLSLTINGENYVDGVDISRAEFYRRLPELNPPPTTGAPGPDQFRQVYEQLADDGATEILSIHVAERLSTTVNSARLAAKNFNRVPVTVFDSRQLSMGLGFQVLTALRLAGEGLPAAEITVRLAEMIPRIYLSAALDSLEYLRRSGRVSGLLAGFGTLLQIKPILSMYDGEPALERVRTRKRALARLVEMLDSLGPLEQAALLHTGAPEQAEAFRQQVAHLLPPGNVPAVEATPVIGTHVGPGIAGFVVVQQE
ncbi:MAG: DegV family protein [Chloroflexi bacterium]|nr:MAG: DegV family protein [Chloroflexota bacterium]